MSIWSRFRVEATKRLPCRERLATIAREAYFLKFARDIQAVAKMPVMVTGGIRRLPVAEQVISSGVDMVGIATALAIGPYLPRDWRLGKHSAPQLPPITWKHKALASLANMAVVKRAPAASVIASRSRLENARGFSSPASASSRGDHGCAGRAARYPALWHAHR